MANKVNSYKKECLVEQEPQLDTSDIYPSIQAFSSYILLGFSLHFFPIALSISEGHSSFHSAFVP